MVITGQLGNNHAMLGNFQLGMGSEDREYIRDTLTIVQDADGFLTEQETSDILLLSQEADRNIVYNKSLSQTLEFVHADQSALTFNEDLTLVRVKKLTQTLTFTDQATTVKVYNRTVTQSLSLVQTLTRNIVSNFDFDDTLTFTDSAEQERVKLFVILQVPSMAIVLPPPLFGDTDALLGTITKKVSMNNVTSTYIKSSSNEKLKYSFDVSRQKSFELKSFVEDHSTELITMRNWKGERWKVRLTNNPFEFTSDRRSSPLDRENVNITLEFEGVRLV